MLKISGVLPLNTYHGIFHLCPCIDEKSMYLKSFQNNLLTEHLLCKIPYHGPRSGNAIPLRRNSCTQSVRSSIGKGSILALATTLTKYSTKCPLYLFS